MNVPKKRIKQEVENQIANFRGWAEEHQDELQEAIKNGMTGSVFVQRVSTRKFYVGWRFTAIGTKVGTIQIDPHARYSPEQEVVWVA